MNHIPAIPSWKTAPTWGNYTWIQMDSTANDSVLLIEAHFLCKACSHTSCRMGRSPSWPWAGQEPPRLGGAVRSSRVTEVAAGHVPTSQAGWISVPWHGQGWDGLAREWGMPQGPWHQQGNTAWGLHKDLQKPKMTLQNWMALGWHIQDPRADRT